MHWTVNVISDVTSTSASVFKYSTTVTQVLPVMPRLKAWNYFQHSTLPVVPGKNNPKYNIPTATVQYLEIVSASDSRNSSKLYSPRPQLLPFDRQDLLSATHPNDHNAARFIPQTHRARGINLALYAKTAVKKSKAALKSPNKSVWDHPQHLISAVVPGRNEPNYLQYTHCGHPVAVPGDRISLSKLVKCPLKISSGYSLTQAIIHCPADVGRLMIRLIVNFFVIVLSTGWFRCSGAGTNVTNILQNIQMLQSAQKWSPNPFKPKHDSERYWPWSTSIQKFGIPFSFLGGVGLGSD